MKRISGTFLRCQEFKISYKSVRTQKYNLSSLLLMLNDKPFMNEFSILMVKEAKSLEIMNLENNIAQR